MADTKIAPTNKAVAFKGKPKLPKLPKLAKKAVGKLRMGGHISDKALKKVTGEE